MYNNLVIDCNSICHMAKHSMGGLSYESQKVGVIFGFLRQLLKLSKLYNTNKFIFCWDSQTSLRKNIFPEYKNNRHKDKTPEDIEFDTLIYGQFNMLKKEIIPQMGFKNNFEFEGFEADDVIAEVVMSHPNRKFVIASTDSDLFQLLFHNEVTLYQLMSKKEITYNDIEQLYGVTPDTWAKVKAISGCVTDNVPGITGVGEKTAIKYLNNQLKHTTKAYQAIKNGQEIIDRNINLVLLPFQGTPETKLQKDTPNFPQFIQVCRQYGFESFLRNDEIGNWEKYLFKESA